MIQNNPRIQSALAEMKSRGISASEAINKALEDSGVIHAIRASYGWASDAASRATQPVRDTAVYKAIAESVEDAFDDETGLSSRYGGYMEKEARRRKREARAKKAGKTRSLRVKANPEYVDSLCGLGDELRALRSPSKQRCGAMQRCVKWFEKWHD
jgi:import inner membrane translocase subunit TIM44